MEEFIHDKQIVGVTAICRPINGDGRLRMTVPTLGEKEEAIVEDGYLILHISDAMASHIEHLLRIRTEKGI